MIISCGKYETNSGARMGQRMSYEPQELSKAELEMKANLCQAIEMKTSRLSQLAPTDRFTFIVSERSCEGQTSQDETVQVRVDVSDNYIHFLRDVTDTHFIFKDAETLRSGIFKSYCNSTQFPFLHNGNPVWVDTQPGEYCSNEAFRTCVNFRSGLRDMNNSDNSYIITTQETFKMDMNKTSPRYGFYTHRTFESSINCEAGTQLIRAKLN